MSDINNTGLSKPQMKNLMKFLSDTTKIPVLGAGGGFAPIGTINFFDATVAPLGWLACDGSVVNIADYPDLATYYASVHGASNFYGGNGTTTFAVPDLRGEFIRGAGTNSHTNQGDGAAVGVHQDGTIVDAIFDSGMINYSLPSGYTMNYDWFIENGRRNTITPGTSRDTDGRLGTTRPTNTSFLICVKATVSGDANAHQYSTEEQIVGTWIDGSDIYEKTINCGAMPNNTAKNVTIPSGISRIVEGHGYFYNPSSKITAILPYGAYNSNSGDAPVNVYFDLTNDKMVLRSNNNMSTFTEGYFTIQYTKTQS